jgi:hypothetical protein
MIMADVRGKVEAKKVGEVLREEMKKRLGKG